MVITTYVETLDRSWIYYYTGCIFGRAPRTKETLSDFCENMDLDKWDTTMWYCETSRKSNFLKKGKIAISVKIRNFSRSKMTKWTSLLDSSHEI